MNLYGEQRPVLARAGEGDAMDNAAISHLHALYGCGCQTAQVLPLAETPTRLPSSAAIRGKPCGPQAGSGA